VGFAEGTADGGFVGIVDGGIDGVFEGLKVRVMVGL